MKQVNQSRRQFLKVSAAVGGGLLLGVQLTSHKQFAQAADTEKDFIPNAWILISPDNSIQITVDRSEMGQGISTALPMLIAEELEVDLAQVSTVFAPLGKAYSNAIIGAQVTGGSTSIRDAWEKLRRAGAVARHLLIEAAAQQWQVSAASCRAHRAQVLHDASGRSANYGDLVGLATTLPPLDADMVELKAVEDFTLIGSPAPRLDLAEKVNGRAVFGLDVQVADMLIASVKRCPVIGGQLKSFDDSAAKKIKGVQAVVKISAGLAVVATNFWAAEQGLKALKIAWDEGENRDLSSESIFQDLQKALLGNELAVAHEVGNMQTARQQSEQIVQAVYVAPYQAHACMEPMNCTAHITAEQCEIWVSTQNQSAVQRTAMQVTGLPAEKIQVHTTYLGGGFGRRTNPDYVQDALEIAKAMGKPIKAVWNREEDIRHDWYRPFSVQAIQADLDKQGKPLSWRHRIASPSIMQFAFPGAVRGGVDRTSVEGVSDMNYAIPHRHVSYALKNPGNVPVWFWRAVGHSQNAFVVESFIDEIAHAGQQDPYELRLELLKDAPRQARVLKLAAKMSGWGRDMPQGQGRGIAAHHSFGSYVAQVAEVEVKQGQVKVKRIVCAVDCGIAVNPDTIEAQMQSAIVYGLTATLKSHITLRKGQVMQSNFHDFQLLRMDEMPHIEVHILKSGEAPGGVGEPGLPPTAPAVLNAVFAATGKRVRELPITAASLA